MWRSSPRAILFNATVPGGHNDPSSEQSDVAWCAAIVKMLHAPVVGSKLAREWFAALERFRSDDAVVASVPQGISSYAVALMEFHRGRPSECGYWMRTAAVMTEDDERAGLALVVLLRAARLLTAGSR